MPGASETDDRFGEAVASADFDRDGYADLAVGQPGENDQAGAVTVVYGSSRGLDTSRSRWISLISDAGQFGSALVAGDFNRDRFPDLAVGAPFADRVVVNEEFLTIGGTVTVLSGGPTGLSTADPVVLRRGSDTWFGAALAAGDLDGDGGTDLVVHIAGEEDDHGDPGSISYCRGQVGGPTGCTRLVHGDAYSGAGTLAVGNISGDSRPEIVLGLRSVHWGFGGTVHILRLGAGAPLAVVRAISLTQDSPGIPGSHESEDAVNNTPDDFGSSVALGDIDRDGYADLAIGAAGENGYEGRLTVVHGAAAGWRTSGNYIYDQDIPGLPGVAEGGDSFRSAVSLRDHNRDGRLDLTIGAAGENGSGAITTLRGSGRGFTTAGARTFGLATLGYPHPAGAQFSAILSRR